MSDRAVPLHPASSANELDADLEEQMGIEEQTGSNASAAKEEKDVVDPKLIGDSSVEHRRKQINRFFGTAAAFLLFGGIAGFAPTYYEFFMTRRWHFDAISHQNFAKVTAAEQQHGSVWKVLLAIHAATTVVWTFLAAFQVASGATGKPGGQRKVAHRRVGYAAAFMAVSICTEAVALQFLKRFGVGSTTILGVAFMICFNLFLGIRYIRQKRVPEHKLAMLWTCAWTAVPGLTRMTNYAQVIFNSGCHIGFYATGAFTVVMLCLVPSALKVRDARSWLFYINVVAILFSCIGDVFVTMRGQAVNGWCSSHL
jgi:uncharacterized membrane protein YozB (DUF420 family)